MAAQNSNKRKEGMLGVKTLIVAGSVAATIAGWAILPANDPVSASSTRQQTDTEQAPAVQVPDFNDQSSQQPAPVPNAQAPATTDLPQVDVPQGFSNRPMPFTNSHSSR